MPLRSLAIIISSTFLALAVLYSPQPLLPFFSRLHGVTEAAAASLISWSMLSMGIGPLFMGYLLQRYSPRHMLSWCLALLAGLTLLFAISASLGWMKVMRFAQGAVIAAQLAATMTYIAGASTNMRQVMAYYVGAAVMGGLIGRITAGFVSEYADWRYFYFVLALALFVCSWQSLSLAEIAETPARGKRQPLSLSRLWRVLKNGYIRRLYLIVVLAFFVMTGILNFVPFRLEQLSQEIGESMISLFYLGYIVGFLVSINAPRIADMLGGTFRAAGLGMGAVLTGLVIASQPSVVAVFFAVMLVTSGFFLQHTSIATMLNRYAGPHAGDVNSLYVSIYYFGGTAGSYLPGLLYIAAGWGYFIMLLLSFMLVSASIALTTRHPADASMYAS